MDEVWKPVPSKPGVQASSLGRITLPARRAQMPNGGERGYSPQPTYGQVRRAKKTAAHSYRGIYAQFYGNIKIHQAVCEAFHGPAPFERAVVIHLNEDAHDNRPENLKWGTQKENLNSAGFLEYCRARKGENNPFIKSRIWRAE